MLNDEQRKENINKLKQLGEYLQNELPAKDKENFRFVLDSKDDYQELNYNYSRLLEEYNQLKIEHEKLKSDIADIQTANAEMYKLLNGIKESEEE